MHVQNDLKNNRETAAKERLADVLAIIKAALRNGYGQPWMFEAMSLSLRSEENEDNSELERVLMSAVDFAKTDDEVIHVASYMANVGLKQRALQLYQDVAERNPFQPTPFVAGLAVAQELNDLEACLLYTSPSPRD